MVVIIFNDIVIITSNTVIIIIIMVAAIDLPVNFSPVTHIVVSGNDICLLLLLSNVFVAFGFK